jgi:hypothetical protein
MADSAQTTGLKWVASATPSGGYGTAATGSADTFLRGDAVFPKPAETDLNLTDVTTANVSTTKHGFAPKLPNDATKYLDGTGAYSVPTSSSGIGEILISDTPSTPLVFADLIQNEAQDDLVYADP